MAKDKKSCCCGCLPKTEKEVKATIPTKTAKEVKEAQKKAK